MQLSEIFDQLINSENMEVTLNVPDLRTVDKIKRDLSNYKMRHKAKYEEILGEFRLKYDERRIDDEITGTEYFLKINIDTADQTQFYEGVTLSGN